MILLGKGDKTYPGEETPIMPGDIMILNNKAQTLEIRRLVENTWENLRFMDGSVLRGALNGDKIERGIGNFIWIICQSVNLKARKLELKDYPDLSFSKNEIVCIFEGKSTQIISGSNKKEAPQSIH